MILRDVEDKPGADYINANYINHDDENLAGKSFKQYIATQGCVSSTRADLWHMVWQENTLLIVMTTKEVERGKTKCAKYWPEPEKTEEYGSYTVVSISEESSKDYTLREFLVSKKDCDEEPRKIFHFHFLGWPGIFSYSFTFYYHTTLHYADHGTPEDPGSVLNFLHDVNLKQESMGKMNIVCKPV